jgi:hypothetical protein
MSFAESILKNSQENKPKAKKAAQPLLEVNS